LMCDRVLLFSTNPGRIVTEIKVPLRQPRDRQDPDFASIVEHIYVEMTARRGAPKLDRIPGTGFAMILPDVSMGLISGLLEAVSGAPYSGNADLPEIASDLQMEVDELFPVAETLQLLRMVEVEGGDIKLTETGRRFANEETDERKRIFARLLIRYVPFAAHIRRVLDERDSHTAPKSRFIDELEDHMTPDMAEQTLNAVIGWTRFAELFAYDDDTGMFSMENPA
ncbi:MAG: AAA-associated domain-containing protein, partial [Rhizomicrobium sp.]